MLSDKDVPLTKDEEEDEEEDDYFMDEYWKKKYVNMTTAQIHNGLVQQLHVFFMVILYFKIFSWVARHRADD